MLQNTNNKEVHLHQGRFGLSILNSMIGEYLEKENNPLSVQMGFYHQSKLIDLNTSIDEQLSSPLSNKVIIFVHGLANLENVWDYPPDDGSTTSILTHYIDVYLDTAAPHIEQNYGTRLQSEHGFTPLFLRYNSGLSLEKNARNFSTLLNKLFDKYPIKIEDLVLVGYGMGGQLLSYTQHAAQVSQADWLGALSKCLYLGNINESSVLSLILKLGSMVMRQLPIYYNHELANWLENRSQQIQAQNDADFYKRNQHAQNTLKNCFLEDKRHYFINGGFKPENTLSSTTPWIPPSAPTHSQNAYLENIAPIRLTHSDRVYELISNWITGQHAHVVPLQTHAPEFPYPISEVMLDSTATNDIGSNDIGNKLFIAGTVDLMASAYDKTVEALETLHYSLTEEPFYVLDGVPVVSQMAKSVESAQREMLDNFYSSLRSKGKKMHRFAAEMA